MDLDVYNYCYTVAGFGGQGQEEIINSHLKTLKETVQKALVRLSK